MSNRNIIMSPQQVDKWGFIIDISFGIIFISGIILILFLHKSCILHCDQSFRPARCNVMKNMIERNTTYADLHYGTEYIDKVYEPYWTINLVGNDTRYTLSKRYPSNYTEGVQECYRDGDGKPQLDKDLCYARCLPDF